jgi:hypothetical protein
MPLLDDNEFDLLGAPLGYREIDAPVAEKAPGFWETLNASFRLENEIGSLASRQQGLGYRVGRKLNEQFDPFSLIPEDKTQYASRYAYANDPNEVQATTRQIDRELADRETVASSGWMGFGSVFAAGLISPINLLPGGAIVKEAKFGTSFLKGALVSGAYGLGAMSASEALLQGSQLTRTGQESLSNVAAGTFLSGLLGGGASVWARAVEKNSGKSFDAFSKLIEEESVVPGSLQRDLMEPNSIPVPREALAKDTGLGTFLERTDNGAIYSKRQPKDFLQVGDVRPEKPIVNRTAKMDLDDASFWLSKVTEDPALADTLATDFLKNFDIKFAHAPNKGAGTGLKMFVPGVGQVYFERGVGIGGLVDAIQGQVKSGKRLDATRVLAGMVRKRGGIEALRDIAKDARVRGLDGEEWIPEDISARIMAEDDARRVEAEIEVSQYAFDVNEKANALLDQLEEARTIEELEAMNPLFFEDTDILAMPESFWDEWSEVEAKTRERIGTQKATDVPRSGEEVPPDRIGESGQTAPVDGTAESGSSDLGSERGGGIPPAGEPVDLAPPKETLNELLKDELILKRLPLLNQQDPLIRTMLSESLATRQVVQRLAETPLKYEKNALGVATSLPVESVIRATKAPLAFSLKAMDDLFVQYRLGRSARVGDKLAQQLTDVIQATPEGKLSFIEFKEEVGKAMRRKDSHGIPEVAAVARQFREEVFTPLLNRAVALELLPEGIETSTAASYLTRVYDIEKINARRTEFVELNLKWLEEKEALKPVAERRSELVLRDVVDQIVDRIVGTPEGRLPYMLLGDDGSPNPMVLNKQSGTGMAKPLHERVYDIPDAYIEQFLVNDVEVVAKIYERTMSADLSMMEEFGSLDLLAELKTIERDYDLKMRVAPDEKAQKRLNAAKQNDIRDIAAMRDRLRGTYRLPQDPMGIASRSGRVVRNLNYLALMGGVTLSSIPDLARSMMVHGLSRYVNDGLVPLISNFKGFRLSAEETKLAGTALDMVLDGRWMAIGEIVDDYGRGSRVEQLLSGAANGYGKVSLISQWTSFQKQFAGMMTQARFLDAAEKTALGTVSKKDRQYLAASYMDEAMAKRVHAQYLKHGDTQGSLRLPNTASWEDREAARAFRAGLAKEVDKIIVTPGQDKPLSLSNEWGKLLFQFKSFFISAAQRVVLAGIQDRDLPLVNGLIFSVGLGMLSVKLQAELKGGREYTPEQLLLEGIDRAGVTGWAFEINNMVEKATRGHWGFSRMVGKEPMSRYANRNLIDSLVGPASGRVEDFARLTGAVASNEWKEGDVRALRRLLPYQNLFYLRWLFDRGEGGLQESLGVPVSD